MPLFTTKPRATMLFIIMAALMSLTAYAQDTPNKISLAHHSNTECTASIRGISTPNLVASYSGTARAQGGVCHVTADEPVEIVLNAPIAPDTLVIEGLKADSVATFYDPYGHIVGTYTREIGFKSESIGLNISRIVITHVGSLLVVNGSFELGPADIEASANHVVNIKNPTDLVGWEVVSGSTDWFGTGIQAADGLRSLDVSGSGPGIIRQIIQTVEGQNYILNFAMSGDSNAKLPELKMLVKAGETSETFAYLLNSENSAQNMLWQYQSLAFVATGPTTEISFESLVEGWYGPAIDDVSVREGGVCSPSVSNEPVEIDFVNKTNERISFHWMDFDCGEGGGTQLAPGANDGGSSTAGHVYRIRGEDGRILGLYVVSADNPIMVVGE